MTLWSSGFAWSLSAWHFSRSVLWVYFRFRTTNILRTNTTKIWRKNKQKNTHQYLTSFKALKHSNILTFDSSIRKFEHFNIQTLVTTHIMKAYWNKNGAMSVHRVFGRGGFLPAILKYQKPMKAWSKTGSHIGESLPGFMRKFGNGDFLFAFCFQISETSDSLE